MGLSVQIISLVSRHRGGIFVAKKLIGFMLSLVDLIEVLLLSAGLWLFVLHISEEIAHLTLNYNRNCVGLPSTMPVFAVGPALHPNRKKCCGPPFVSGQTCWSHSDYWK